MASILKVDTLTGVTTAGSISVTGEGNSTTTNLQQGLSKAWVNFNATSTAAIRDSLNHSSLTDNGTGDFTLNYSSAMGNANYCQTEAASRYHAVIADATGFSAADPTTTTARWQFYASGPSISDGHYSCVAVLGDLA